MKNVHQEPELESSSSVKSICIWLAFFIGLLAVFYCLGRVLTYHHNINYFLNFDLTTYPGLGHNLIYQGGHLSSWHLGAAPYVFPEILFFYIFSLFSVSTYASLLTFMVLQVLAFIVAMIWLFRTTISNNIGLRLGLFYSLLFSLLCLSKRSFNAYGTKALFATVFLPSYHFAAALMALFSLILFIKIFTKPRLYLKIILFVLIFLGGISDALTYVYFLFPMLATLTVLLIFKELEWRKYVNLCLWLCVAFIVSYSAYQFLPIQITKVSIAPTIGFSYFAAYIKTIAVFFQTQTVLALLWLIFLIWAPISLWRSRGLKQGIERKVDFVILFQFVTVLVSTPLLIFAIGQVGTAHLVDGSLHAFLNNSTSFYNKLNGFPFRYLVNYYMFPIYFGLTFLFYKHTKHILSLYKVRNYFILIVLLVLGLIFLPPRQLQMNKLVNFHSSLAMCFELHVKTYGLTNGISNDFLSINLMNAYIPTKHQVAQVDPETLTPVLWIDTSERFTQSNYNFVYSPSPRFLAKIKQYYGKPNAVFICHSKVYHPKVRKYYFYVYNNGQLNKFFSH